MKILNCFLDNRFGGPQKRAYIVARELKKCGFETVFLFNEKLKNNIPIDGFDCFLIKHIQCIRQNSTIVNLLLFLLWLPYNLYKICKIIRGKKIDVVHISGILNIVPAVAGKFNKSKILWHFDDTLTPQILRRLLLPWARILSDEITIAAESLRNYYFKKTDKSWGEAIVLYDPVDINEFSPDSNNRKNIKDLRAKLNISPGDFIIGTIGNINIAKGYEYFIRAAGIIRENLMNVKFLIVGSRLNSQEKYWQKLQDLVSELDLADCVKFIGFRKDIANLLSIMDVFVLSSVSEACPIVVLEAMAMKVPVVATNVGGVSEQIQNNYTGLLVPPQYPQAIAETVLKLLAASKVEVEKLTTNARKRVESVFSLRNITEQHKNLYKLAEVDSQ